MIERIDQQTAALQTHAATATKATPPVSGPTDATPTSAGELVLPYPTDRVEISEQGYAGTAQRQAADSAAQAANATGQAVAQAAASSDTEDAEAVAQAVAKATEEASSSNTNLTSLSEQQIEALVKEGSISRAQADSELSSRQGE